MRKITVDGNEACANTAYMFTEVTGIYPITPSSPMAELVDSWSNSGKLNIFNDKVKVVEMQSEAGAAGMIHGSLQTGLLTTTFTASQGLLLMIPNMYKIAGEMLPGVMHVAARSLSTHALSIFGDHQDIYATRQTGFCLLASSSVQDAAFLSAVAHLSAIKGNLPFLHFFDGFRTSHEIDKINVLEDDELKSLVDYDAINKFRSRALNPMNPKTKGTAQNDDIYFQVTESRNKLYLDMPNIVNNYMEKLNKIANTDYKPFNYYGTKTANKIIVAMGSVCETIKSVIDHEKNYGLIEVHLYRPFSVEYLLKVLPDTVTDIAVLDRTKESGSIGEPLYLDIVASLKNKNINIVGGRYGLSSKDTTPAQIKAVYDMLDNPKNNFTIGIEDDVTNLSLPIDKEYKISNSTEFLIYGYGSDGMVSASKSIMKLVGNSTDKFVQGYFQYDSKKSGGVTIGHLRFSDNIIRSTYYVQEPILVVCTKESYMNNFEVIENIKKNGTFILNTTKSNKEILKMLPSKVKNIIVDRNIKFYIIDAYSKAKEVGLGDKISTIMESIIVKLSNLVDYESAKEEMKEYAKKRYGKKGEEIVKSNYRAIDEAIPSLVEIKIESKEEIKEKKSNDSLYKLITDRKGNDLKVSSFMDMQDGTFEASLSSLDKRCASEQVPKHIVDNCIMCNQCSFVCPHGVIRPFLIDEKEYKLLPNNIKERCKKPILPNLKQYYYVLSISVSDCTGCGLCINTCPSTKGKALEFTTLNLEEQEIFNYLNKNIKDKNIDPTNVINSQFTKSKFNYCGACAGCGEAPYIKVLTQLFGREMVIANATGCSSIYGGSAPSTAYSLPWASSLFEDNAEYGYGMVVATRTIRNRIKNIMESNLNSSNKELFTKWLNNMEDYKITKEVYDNIDYSKIEELIPLKDYITSRSIWMIGGDGWAYDIGYGGIDHILATNDNFNILVLDSQVYSNTGGQTSKASPKGVVASFASTGKVQNKKDLARIALAYPHVFVAQISLGANMNQMLKVLKEAKEYNGPSIVIAYSPCISHGIKGGMSHSVEVEALASKSGYFPIFSYNPSTKVFDLNTNVDFNLYDEFLQSQTRYSILKTLNPENYEKLLQENKQNAIDRYNYYKNLTVK